MTIEELLAIIEELQAQIEELMKAQGEAPAEQFTKFNTEIQGVKAKLTTFEKALNDAVANFERAGGGAGGIKAAHKTIGQLFANDPDVVEAAKSARGVRFTTNTDASGGILTPKQRLEEVPLMPQVLIIRDLMTVLPTSADAVDWVEETGFVNGATAHADGEEAGEFEITFKQKQEALKTISGSYPISKRAYNDKRLLAAIVDERVIFGVLLAENKHIMDTVRNHAKIQKYNGVTEGAVGDTPLDNLRKAKAKQSVAGYPVEAILVNPITLGDIETLKDSQGRYVVEIKDGQIWRSPVYESNDVPVGKAVMGSIRSGAFLFDGEKVSLEAGNQHDKNFTSGMLTILGEELALAVLTRPESFIEVTFGAPAA